MRIETYFNSISDFLRISYTLYIAPYGVSFRGGEGGICPPLLVLPPLEVGLARHV